MKNGFTLIELLAVITILSIIATITLFATGTILKDAKESLSETQKAKLVEAAKMYYLENSTASYVCVDDLIDDGYLEGTTVLDPKDKTEIHGFILITKSTNKVTYEYNEDDGRCSE